jgi:pimeloyl-ACP methyl ester carboxylesterase
MGMVASAVSTAVGPIEAAVAGGGRAVVLVHGLPGSWRQLVPLAEDLAAHHTVVLPSRPGYGTTPLAAGRTYHEQAAAYAALLDALGLTSAAVIGVSGGAPSAAAFAADYPDRTTALVLACPLAPELARIPATLGLAAVPGLGEVLTALYRARRGRQLADPAATERLIRKELSPSELAVLDDELRAEVVRFARSHLGAPAGLAGLRNDLVQARRAGTSTSARTNTTATATSTITAPTLILHGDADTVVPVDHAGAYAAAIPGAVLELLDGAGHGFLLTRRAEAVPRLERFLRQTESELA